MSERADHQILIYKGMKWEYDPDLTKRNIEYHGPLCVRKSCHMYMQRISDNTYKCMECDYSVNVDMDHSALEQLVIQKLLSLDRSKMKAIDMDRLPSINETLEEENRFYKVSVAHSDTGDLNDVHILIVRKDGIGKKAHIIISPNGEVRFDKKDLPPGDEIASITSVIFK